MSTETQVQGTLCWFDIPFDDQERAHKFYGELFGWTFDAHAASPIPYHFARGSAEPGSGGVPEMADCCGGLMPRQQPEQPILLYFKVASINDTCVKVVELGGEVLCPKQEVPGYGAFSVIKDSEGNLLSLWEVAAK